MSRIVKSEFPEQSPPPSVKKAAILNAAKARFARYGFSKVTMDEIAHDIGIVKGAVYYYFPTKEKIFEEVIREVQEAFLGEIENLLHRNSTSGRKLSGYVRIRQRYLDRLENIGQLDYESWQKIRPSFQELFSEFQDREVSCLQKILEEGRATGEFSLSETRNHAMLFLRSIKGLRLLNALLRGAPRQESPKPNEEIQFLTAVFLDALRRRTERRTSRQ